MATAAEATMVCLDNSFWMDGHPLCDVQVEAVKLYCEIKFKCNAENHVGLFRMATDNYGPMLSPTNDHEKILDFLSCVCFECSGQAEFSQALNVSCCTLQYHFPNMKRRLLMFVASPINLGWTAVERLGKFVKECDVALDIVNFYFLGEDRSHVERSILYGRYHYGREQFDELLASINDNGNSQIVDVHDESCVFGTLKMTILKKHLRYVKKKDKKKAKKNVKVKQKRDPPSCNEKNKAAAEYSEHPPLVMDPKPGKNEKVKLKAV